MQLSDYFVAIVTFCLVLFLYIHIQFHLKTSNDLEIYELEQVSKTMLEDICDIMQPVLIDVEGEEEMLKMIETTNKSALLTFYAMFDVKIRNVKDIGGNNDMILPLTLEVAEKLFAEDKDSLYFSEGNGEFLQETGVIKHLSYNDSFLRPSLVCNCNYDVMFGSSKVETPFRYDLNYRNYYLITQGQVKVKLTPPSSSKYLNCIKDYESLEFKSPINPWNPQVKYKADFERIKCLELSLKVGQLLFIPPYWWYSFQLEKDSSVSSLKYRTYMNNLAISPHICLYALQNQNIERKIAKKVETE